jgi:hypothetical protein
MHRIARWTAALTLTLAIWPMSACVYFHVKQPLDTDLDETQLGTKVGKSQAQSILGIVAWGDAGTQAAARDGGITTLRHADQETLAILGGVYARFRTIVYGD